MVIAEVIGLALIGYGIWFAVRGVRMWLGTDRDWWRPVSYSKRYPYPAAGILLGVCFAFLGARFALDNVWNSARILGYVGGAIFVIVLVAGIGQPRVLHPRWYGVLEDRLGKKEMMRLRSAAFRLDSDEWSEISASGDLFDEWVEITVPRQQQQGRGYTKRS